MSTTSAFVTDACRILSTPAALRFATRIAGQREAEDVLQDAALVVLLADSRGHVPRLSTAALTFTILRHAATDRLARRGRQVSVVSDVIDRLVETGDAELDAASSIDRARDVDWLHEALAKIPPEQAEQISMTYLDPNAPPVRKRDVPFGTVVSRTSRGLAALRLAAGQR